MSLLNKVFKKKEESNRQNSEFEKEVNVKKFEKDADKADIEESKARVNNNMEARKNSIGFRILVKPLVTEKTANLAKEGKYVFEISNIVNKIEVKKALKDVYGVKAIDVNVIKMKGKRTGGMRRVVGKRKNWKKAVVTLKKGESLNVYSGYGEKL